MRKLAENEIQEQLENLSNWTLNNKSITNTYTFKDFNEAMEVINKIALIANELNHHPEWSNVYNNLSITLTTHDANGLSDLDITFAKKVDLLISNYN